jgi:2-polyprenyl-6-methoxyphenol hydroxylase-like FAD-dependent oxidoreductase
LLRHNSSCHCSFPTKSFIFFFFLSSVYQKISAQNWRPGKRVVIAGGGPGAISKGLAFLKRGFDVRIFERQPECKAIGGAVLLSTPILAILRSYGMSLDNVGSYTRTYFKNKSGDDRMQLPFNTEVERRMGIKGWHYGDLRSSAFKQMLELVPEGAIYTNHEFSSYTELADGSVEVEFTNGKKITGDILVGADGIRSGVSRQAFGDPKLFHTGIRLWVAWCDHIPGIEPNLGMVSHNWQYQASFFPMLHDGKPGFEWLVVEPSWEGKPLPADPKAHLTEILKDWAQPMPRFTEVTYFDTQV